MLFGNPAVARFFTEQQIQKLKRETLAKRETAEKLKAYLDILWNYVDFIIGEWKSTPAGQKLGHDKLDNMRKYIKRGIKKCKIHLRIILKELGHEEALETLRRKNKDLGEMLVREKRMVRLEDKDEYIIREFNAEMGEARKLFDEHKGYFLSVKGAFTEKVRKEAEKQVEQIDYTISFIATLTMKTMKLLTEEHRDLETFII